MCITTAALISGGSAIAGLAGTAVNAAGTAASGTATATAAAYNAQVAANNAITANQNANYSIDAGQAKTADVSMANAQNMGKIKTAQASSGVDVNTGSSVDVQESAREVGQLNATRTLNNAQLQAYGYRTQATNFTAQSQLDTMQEGSAIQGAELSEAGGILGGISGVAGKWATGGSNPFSGVTVPGFNPIAGISGSGP